MQNSEIVMRDNMRESRSRYFSQLNKIETPSARIIAFPHAGAGAVAYHQWAPLLPDDIELIAIQYPGRGRLRDLNPCASIDELAQEACKTVSLFTEKPTYFFGHSMGANVALQTIRLLMRTGGRLPNAFIVSACGAPPSDSCQGRSLHALPDDRFLEFVMDYGGIPSELLQSSDMLSYILPLLRADLTAHETWRTSVYPKLTMPMLVLRGESDPMVNQAKQQRWSEFTDGTIDFQVVQGGHFFTKDELAHVIDLVSGMIKDTNRANNL